MYKVSFGSPFSFAFRALLSAFGLVMIVGSTSIPPLIIVGPLLIYCAWATGKEQITDIANWRTRKGWIVIPFRFGKWVPLGRPDTVLLSKDIKRDHIAGPISAQQLSRSEVYYEVDLVEDDSRFDTLLRTSDPEKAKQFAERLCKDLEIPLKDIRE